MSHKTRRPVVVADICRRLVGGSGKKPNSSPSNAPRTSPVGVPRTRPKTTPYAPSSTTTPQQREEVGEGFLAIYKVRYQRTKGHDSRLVSRAQDGTHTET